MLENVTLAPIQVRKFTKPQANEIARQLLDRVGILEQAQKYPGKLSGGQQQRVAIARALAMDLKLCCLTNRPHRLTPRWFAKC